MSDGSPQVSSFKSQGVSSSNVAKTNTPALAPKSKDNNGNSQSVSIGKAPVKPTNNGKVSVDWKQIPELKRFIDKIDPNLLEKFEKELKEAGFLSNLRPDDKIKYFILTGNYRAARLFAKEKGYSDKELKELNIWNFFASKEDKKFALELIEKNISIEECLAMKAGRTTVPLSKETQDAIDKKMEKFSESAVVRDIKDWSKEILNKEARNRKFDFGNFSNEDMKKAADSILNSQLADAVRKKAYGEELTKEEKNLVNGWKISPQNEKLALLWAKKASGEKLTKEEEKQLFEGIRNYVASRLSLAKKSNSSDSSQNLNEDYVKFLNQILEQYKARRKDYEAQRLDEISKITDPKEKKKALYEFEMEKASLEPDQKTREKLELEARVRYEEGEEFLKTTLPNHIKKVKETLEDINKRYAELTKKLSNIQQQRAEGKAVDEKVVQELKEEIIKLNEEIKNHIAHFEKNDVARRASRFDERQTFELIRNFGTKNFNLTEFKEIVENLTTKSTAQIFIEWGIPKERAQLLEKLVKEKGFNEEKIRQIATNVRFLNTLPEDARKAISGNTLPIDGYQVAVLLSEGKIDKDHRLAFILDNKKFHESFEQYLRKSQEALWGKEHELQKLEEEENKIIEELAKETGKGVGKLAEWLPFLSDKDNTLNESQKAKVRRLLEIKKQKEELQKEIVSKSVKLQMLEITQANFNVIWYINHGDKKEADNYLISLFKKHGGNLKQLSPFLWNELTKQGGTLERLHKQGKIKFLPSKYINWINSNNSSSLPQTLLKQYMNYGTELDKELIRAIAFEKIDSDKSISTLQKTATSLNNTLPKLQRLLSAGLQKGATKYEDFVEFLRNEGKELYELLNSADFKTSLDGTKNLIKSLKETLKVTTDKTAKQELEQRIKGLEALTALFESKDIKNVIDLLRDKSKLSPDTWEAWIKKDGVVVLSSVAVAVAAIVTTIATMGAAAPAWAVFFAAAAAGAAGELLGKEGAREILYQVNQGGEDGLIWTDRSNVGAWLAKLPDRIAKENFLEILKSFDKEVVQPYTMEFLKSFAFTIATMGIGKGLASKISSGLNKILRTPVGRRLLASNNPILKRIVNKLGRINSIAGNQTVKQSLFKQIAKMFGKEFPEELTDEALETVLKVALEKIDKRLAILSSVLIATGRGLKINTNTNNELTYNPNQKNDLIKSLKSEGHKVIIMPDSTIFVKGYNGETMYLRADANSKQVSNQSINEFLSSLPNETQNVLKADKNLEALLKNNPHTRIIVDKNLLSNAETKTVIDETGKKTVSIKITPEVLALLNSGDPVKREQGLKILKEELVHTQQEVLDPNNMRIEEYIARRILLEVGADLKAGNNNVTGHKAHLEHLIREGKFSEARKYAQKYNLIGALDLMQYDIDYKQSLLSDGKTKISTSFNVSSLKKDSNIWGRPVIGMDTKIDGGVYPGATPREAIVVDIAKSPQLENFYNKIKSEISKNKLNLENILKLVHSEVFKAYTKHSNSAINALLDQYNVGKDQKIDLGVFLKAQTGNCRHRALTAAAVIEKLIQDGVIKGKVSIDRNETDSGAHAWVRFTDADGKVTIIDPMHNYFGPLRGKGNHWNYLRPDDAKNGEPVGQHGRTIHVKQRGAKVKGPPPLPVQQKKGPPPLPQVDGFAKLTETYTKPFTISGSKLMVYKWDDLPANLKSKLNKDVGFFIVDPETGSYKGLRDMNGAHPELIKASDLIGNKFSQDAVGKLQGAYIARQGNKITVIWPGQKGKSSSSTQNNTTSIQQRTLQDIAKDIENNPHFAEKLIEPQNEKLLSLVGNLTKPNGKISNSEHFANSSKAAGFETPQQARAAIKKLLSSNGKVGNDLWKQVSGVIPQHETLTSLTIPKPQNTSPNWEVKEIKTKIKDLEIKRNHDTGEVIISVKNSVSDARIHNNLLKRIFEGIKLGKGIQDLSSREIKIEKTIGNRSLVCVHGRTNSRIWGVYDSSTGTLTWEGIAPDHSSWKSIISNFQ